MKKLMVSSLIFVIALFTIQAGANIPDLTPTQVIHLFSNMVVHSPSSTNFDWKVGDTLVFNMRIKPVPVTATAKLSLTSITQEGMTLVQEVSYKTIKETIEMLMDRDTGEVKRIKINGKEQKLPAAGVGGGTKLIKEEAVYGFKVPAGTFDAIHMITEDSQGNQTEAWLNPRDIPLSGLLKSSAVQGDLLTVEMELVSFARGH